MCSLSFICVNHSFVYQLMFRPLTQLAFQRLPPSILGPLGIRATRARDLPMYLHASRVRIGNVILFFYSPFLSYLVSRQPFYSLFLSYNRWCCPSCITDKTWSYRRHCQNSSCTLWENWKYHCDWYVKLDIICFFLFSTSLEKCRLVTFTRVLFLQLLNLWCIWFVT